MKILSIGNSFSVDAQAWVREIALAGGAEITLGNIYIGGCSLERHMENVKSGLPAYEYYKNNHPVGLCAIQTALEDETWDFITLQQASHFSGKPETYTPFIDELAAYARAKCPGAQIAVHETWAYETGSAHAAFPEYGCDRKLMHNRLRDAYASAARRIGAKVIPVGEAVRIARENALFDPERGGLALTRDGFHLSLTRGRYLAGAVWYGFFTGLDPRENAFVPSRKVYLGRDLQTGEIKLAPLADDLPSQAEMTALRQCAWDALQGL